MDGLKMILGLFVLGLVAFYSGVRPNPVISSAQPRQVNFCGTVSGSYMQILEVSLPRGDDRGKV